jgi:DNA invertase Pin-like site-specific DNA recombinase
MHLEIGERERTMAGLAAARARGRTGGRKPVFTASKLRRAQAAMASRDTHVMDLCEELGDSRAALYNHVKPTGELTERGAALLQK